MKTFIPVTVLMAAMVFGTTAHANVDTECREWAVMDGIDQDNLAVYLEECRANMNSEYEEPVSDESIEMASSDYEQPYSDDAASEVEADYDESEQAVVE